MPTESQLEDKQLRLSVRQRIEDGRLPLMLPKQIAGGYGSGRKCVACDRPIASTEVEYEVEDCRSDSPLSFHLGCHVVWQLECQAKLRAQAPALSAAAMP